MLKERTSCLSCGIKFVPGRCTRGQFCDRKCANFGKLRRVKKTCFTCHRKFSKKKSETKRTDNNFCSVQCYLTRFTVHTDRVKQLKQEGQSLRSIAKIIGCNQATVWRMVHANTEIIKNYGRK